METQINQEIVKETESLVVKTEQLVQGFKVNSQPTLVKANDYLVQITQAEKKVIKREREILDPLNQAKKSIMDFFRPVKERLANIKYGLKREMGGYVEEMEKVELRKKAEIEKKVESGKMDIDKAVEKIEKIEEKKAAVITRTNRIVQITDKTKIPQKYWKIDMVPLRKDALSGFEIPGVKVVEEKIIVGKKV